MKKRYLTALVVLGVMMAGCTKQPEEIPGQAGNDQTFVTLTADITLGEDSGTKALTAEGVKAFAVDDVIAVVYENTDGAMVKTESAALTDADITNEGKKAKITVTLTNPAESGFLRYIYPAAMANSDGSVNYDALKTQKGTLASLADQFDLAIYEGTLTASAQLPAVSLTNPLCIGEFTIKDDGSNIITSTLTGFYVSDGTNSYFVSRSAQAGPIYVAMRPIANEATISLAAQTETTYYERTVTGKTLAASNIYPVSVRMEQTQTVNLSKLGNDYSAQNGNTLTGKLALCKEISIADGATVTLRDVDINGDGSLREHKNPGINCTGDATLVIKGTNLVNGSNYGSNAGIQNKNNHTLTIEGDGSLTAKGYAGAGIGCGKSTRKACGNILIKSGNITAIGGSGSAGIGCGTGGTRCQDITITGGTVTATGDTGAAGIGTGFYDPDRTDTYRTQECGKITISGGTVNATGGKNAAGIGLGLIFYMKNGTSDHNIATNRCGDITITKDVTSVTATKGVADYNPIYCIGKGGKNSSNINNVVGTITIGGFVYTDGGVDPESGDTYIYEPQH